MIVCGEDELEDEEERRPSAGPVEVMRTGARIAGVGTSGAVLAQVGALKAPPCCSSPSCGFSALLC
jgi:hypothetical protein